MIKKITFFLLFLIWVHPAFSQKSVIADKVVAVVGDKVILESDIQRDLAQEGQDNPAIRNNPNARCTLLANIMTQKLLLIQAAIDSVTIDDAEVESSLNQRFNYMMRAYYGGDQDKMEEALGKSLLEYKEEIRPEAYDNQLAKKMQDKLVEKATVSPAEVTKFYEASRDSLPLISTEILVGQITKMAKWSSAEKEAARAKTLDIREQIRSGKKFETMALLYSQDPGSSAKEGDLGFMTRGTLVPAFEAVAFRLKPGELSPPVETEYGFHLIQVVERRGNQIHVRHILIIPEQNQGDLDSAKRQLDSAYKQVRDKRLSYAQAAVLYSDDESSKGNAGILSAAAIPLEQLEQDDHSKPTMFSVVDTMKNGDMTTPMAFTSVNAQQQKKGYRIIFLKSKTEPHKTNLQQDYSRIQAFALQDKQKRTLSDWVNRKKKTTYIRIDPDYLTCPDMQSWVKENNRF